MYFIYIIQSKKDGNFYIGQTEDIEKRLARHNRGAVPSTRQRKPFLLVYQEQFSTRVEAIQRERYLKSLKGGNEFHRIIQT